MKQQCYITLLLLFFLSGCDSEHASDCFQKAGTIVQQEIDLPSFNKIVIHKKVGLVIKEGPVQQVIIESGENLMPEISAIVTDGELVVRNTNTCNFVRDYGLTTVYITSPNLTVIRNSSEQDVRAEGIITYPSLYLRSSGEGTSHLAIGDFYMHIENEYLRIWGNGRANLNISGLSDKMDLIFSDGDTRFNGQDFKVKEIDIKQASTNDMLIYPVEKLTGSIHSTGNVIAFNTPPLIEVDVQNIGQLILK